MVYFGFSKHFEMPTLGCYFLLFFFSVLSYTLVIVFDSRWKGRVGRLCGGKKKLKDQCLEEYFLISGIFFLEIFIDIIVGLHAVVRNNM